MQFSIIHQEYAQVYKTQQPEDSNCGETNLVVNSIPLLLRLTHPIHYYRVALLVCFLSLSHRSPTQGSKEPAFTLVAQKNPLLHLIHIFFFPAVLVRLHIEISFCPDQLYTEELADKKNHKAFSDNLCGINKTLLSKCSACSASSYLFSLKTIPGPFPVSHTV